MFIMPYLMAFMPMVMAAACFAAGKKRKRLRDTLALLTGAVELALSAVVLVYVMGGGEIVTRVSGVAALGITFKVDGFRALYAAIASLMWCMTLLMSPEYFRHYHNRTRYYFFNLLTLGATVGLFLADDLYTVFIFFEIMSFASYPWVAHEQSKEALKAAQTYLAIAVLGGMVTLMGLFILFAQCGTLAFEGLRAYAASLTDISSLYLPGALVFFGFAAKAGVFPMHVWLPKAHPVAPAPASALLSGILTKAGVFGILVVSSNLFLHDAAWGNWMLLLGVITMMLGAVLALFSVNLKRTLACSSMSQIGFIMVGVGMQGLLGAHNALAIQGTLLHMVNHSLIKLVLFMAAGVVFMNLHALDLNQVRGFGRKKPLLNFAFLMGYLGIIGMPLLNGYISKSLLHESILEYVHLLTAAGTPAQMYSLVEVLFLITGGMTAAYMTKLYVCLFIQKNADPVVQQRYDEKKKYMSGLTAFALTFSAVLPLFGLLPDVFMTGMARLGAPFMHGSVHEVAYFSGENLLGAAKSLLIGGVLYAGVWLLLMKNEKGVRVYVNRWPAWLDLEDSVYRPLVTKVLPAILYVVAFIPGQMVDSVVFFFRHTAFSHLRAAKTPPVGTRWTWKLGTMLNRVVALLNRTVRKARLIETDFVATLAAWREEMMMSSRRVSRSVSFGLLLLCVGLFVTFAYLLSL